MSLVSVLSERRKELKLSQKEVEAMCGFKSRRYAQIERGHVVPNADDLEAIGRALNIEIEVESTEDANLIELN